jgi:hypothetical protein
VSLPYLDVDLDGTPAIMEYVTGGDPYVAEPVPSISNGLSFRVLDDAADPGIDVEVSPGIGRWPVFRSELFLASNESPAGEGYWNDQAWAAAGQAEHFRFSINNEENWFLLEADSPVRWVREDADGWVWSPWFGWLYTPSAPWLFHPSLGWIYDQGGFLYSSSLSGYLFPDVGTHPWIATDSGYIYILESSPWVYDSTSGTWMQTY